MRLSPIASRIVTGESLAPLRDKVLAQRIPEGRRVAEPETGVLPVRNHLADPVCVQPTIRGWSQDMQRNICLF